MSKLAGSAFSTVKNTAFLLLNEDTGFEDVTLGSSEIVMNFFTISDIFWLKD